MKKCKELILFSKEYIIDIIVVSILGTVLHFAFKISGKNLLVALFSATNESVWEHIKIAVVPTYLVAIVKMFIQEDRKCNLWSSLFFKVLSQIILIPLLYYGYIAIFKVENMVVDIAIYYITIIISEFVEYIIQNKFKISSNSEDKFKYLNLGIIILFCVFTFIQPKFELFKDKKMNKYGI